MAPAPIAVAPMKSRLFILWGVENESIKLADESGNAIFQGDINR
jgi:hypothetical protein